MDRFLIAPLNVGLETDLKPFLIPDDAFPTLNNAYIFRGRVRKRFGSNWIGTSALNSRFSINLGNTDNTGAATGTLPGVIFKVGQQFAIGTEIFTVSVTGTPAIMLTTGAASTHTLNTTTGVYTFAGATPLTQIYFYPAEPVMGLTNYENGAVNNEPLFGFDTQFAYLFAGGTWNISPTPYLGLPLWHDPTKDKLNFFWTTTWNGITADISTMFVSNFQVINTNGLIDANDDPIWAYDSTNGWQTFTPKFKVGSAGDLVRTAKIIVPFKDRLLLLNTIETDSTQTNNISYPQRCRYCHNGSPFPDGTAVVSAGTTDGAGHLIGTIPATYAPFVPGQGFSIGTEFFTVTALGTPNVMSTTGSSTVHTFNTTTGGFEFTGAAINTAILFYPDVSAWLEQNQIGFGGAGWVDAATEEAIVSAEFIKDRLIVYFERSTWELAYTGNQVLPFVWQKLNTELGSEATFSSVPFDKVILTIGNTGVHACNGSNVERIDDKIPDEIFEIKNKDEGVERICGIRDYKTEMVYWTFPNTSEKTYTGNSVTYPNKVLVYNYKTGSWAFNDDCFTAFGYYEQQSDTTWATANTTWANATYSWNSGVIAAEFRQVIAGNQQGYVSIIDADETTNAPVMQITNITNSGLVLTLTVIDHTLMEDDYIQITGVQGATIGGTGISQVQATPDKDTIKIIVASYSGTYTGGGLISRVSNINITSKQWNFYLQQDKNATINKIDFCVDKTSNGQVTIDYFPSSSNLSLLDAGKVTGTILGNGILETNPYTLYPLENEQERLWHPVYLQAEGNGIQITISMSDDQITTPAIMASDFQLHGLVVYATPTSDRLS